MGRELLLLRHGKSDWSVGAPDVGRPLANRGKRAAQRMGVHLACEGWLPDHVVSSPAERARTTAHKACKAMGLGVAAIAYDERIYEADLSALLQVLADRPLDRRRVLLVGHNPGLEALIGYLAGGRLEGRRGTKTMPTAALARLALPESWSALTPGAAELLALVRPRELPKSFPFPAPDGEVRRPRPAYYYQQSAAIPYRRRGGRLEVLVISSRSGKRWGVPKGIQEPGLEAHDSAAKEALEEAGIEGQVGREVVGRFEYEKWGGTCKVEVYLMRVLRHVDDPRWVERERQRRWLSPEEAASVITVEELRSIVRSLPELLARA